MKDAEFRNIDRLALAMAREGKERSKALPAKAYRDPAETVEFPSELARQEAVRKARAAKQKRGIQDER